MIGLEFISENLGLKLQNCNHAIIQVVSKDKKDRRKKSRFGNEEQLKKKSLFPNAVPRIFFNPSRHIRKLESEILSEATMDYPEQGCLLMSTDNCSVLKETWPKRIY